MPSYFYHLKFELYPSPRPTSRRLHDNPSHPYWLPPPDTSVFGNLPSHPRRITPRPSPPPTAAPGASPAGRANPPATGHSPSAVIDCGASRTPADENKNKKIERLSERQWKSRSQSFPPPRATAAIRPETAQNDWRFGELCVESVDMPKGGIPAMEAAPEGEASGAAVAPVASQDIGPQFGGPGTSTRAQMLAIESNNTNIGWGIVHFYREGEETPMLGLPLSEDASGLNEEQCTTLCIPAVPSYMSPSDFLGFIGEKWKSDISHYRMVMSPKMNRYLVLMKARDAKKARAWRKEFDGKAFDSISTEICHVVYVKSITFDTPTVPRDTASPSAHRSSPSMSKVSASSSLKPFPPPTPSLIELPTCPVCLERMDDTTGLMTIPCQHIFHCTCLQNWSGSGCPVCRHTNPSQLGEYDPANPYSQPFGASSSNLCSVCDSSSELWICLICGNVGCGRYKGGHAKDHWKETAHCFALELETQHVWDYAGDLWVHRLIREKGDGKVVELPGNTRNPRAGGHDNEDLVPRAKLDNMGLEYARLVSSQLESQRAYFEEQLSKAADKTAKASSDIEKMTAAMARMSEQVRQMEEEMKALKAETIPQLERDFERERKKAAKSQELARNLSKTLQEEKGVGEGLMTRVEHVNKEKGELEKEMLALKKKVEELEETNTDLSLFISSQEKLKEMEREGLIQAEDLVDSTVGVAESSKKGKGKKKK